MVSSDRRVDIVIAKYEEDISWTRLLKDNVIVYDKSNHPVEGAIRLPNLGREAHTYLYHIVKNYDNLADYTIFLQGKPYDHTYKLPNPTNESCAEYINRIQYPIEYQGFLQDLTDWDTPYADLGVISEHVNRRKIFVEQMNLSQKFSRGAQYIVPKENLLAKPYAFYKKLFDMSDTNIQFIADNKKLCPWCLERVWPFIFDTRYQVHPEFL